MTFADTEVSIHDGRPIELYRFISPTTTYRYTSAGQDFDLDGEIFQAQPIQRNALQGTSQDDSPTLDIQIAIIAEVVQDFAFQISENNLRLELLRSHGTTATTSLIWEGDVSGIGVRGRTARIRVPSRFGSSLSAPVPSVYYQSQCNHSLYDARCQVARSAFQQNTQTDTVAQTAITVASVGGNPDQWFLGGEIVRVTDGERRLIVRQIGLNLVINFPFRTMNVGDQVQLFAGCDRTARTCRDKFSNIINFGGHPLIPLQNVFETGLN